MLVKMTELVPIERIASRSPWKDRDRPEDLSAIVLVDRTGVAKFNYRDNEQMDVPKNTNDINRVKTGYS